MEIIAMKSFLKMWNNEVMYIHADKTRDMQPKTLIKCYVLHDREVIIVI